MCSFSVSFDTIFSCPLLLLWCVCLSFLFSGTLTYANHNRSQTAGLLLLVRFLAESPMVLCWVQCANGSGLNLFLSRFGIIGRLLWLEWGPLLVAAVWEVLHGKSTSLSEPPNRDCLPRLTCDQQLFPPEGRVKRRHNSETDWRSSPFVCHFQHLCSSLVFGCNRSIVVVCLLI